METAAIQTIVIEVKMEIIITIIIVKVNIEKNCNLVSHLFL